MKTFFKFAVICLIGLLAFSSFCNKKSSSTSSKAPLLYVDAKREAANGSIYATIDGQKGVVSVSNGIKITVEARGVEVFPELVFKMKPISPVSENWGQAVYTVGKAVDTMSCKLESNLSTIEITTGALKGKKINFYRAEEKEQTWIEWLDGWFK